MEVELGRHAAVELAVELIRADLPGQVDRQRLRQGDHLVVLGDDRGMRDVVDRAEVEHRIAIEKVVERPVAEAEAGDDLSGWRVLRRPVTTPRRMRSSTGLVITLEWTPRSFRSTR